MGGREWTPEEILLLEDLTAKYPVKAIAKRLNRSEHAVLLKRHRLGIGGFKTNTDMLTRSALAEILGIEDRTLQYWERKGLKSIHKKPYVMYRHEDILRYMEEHPEDWNAARINDDTMFTQYQWYREKRKTDKSHKYNWTQMETAHLKMLRHQGYTIREIAKKMGRSESSIKYKLYYNRQASKPEEQSGWPKANS